MDQTRAGKSGEGCDYGQSASRSFGFNGGAAVTAWRAGADVAGFDRAGGWGRGGAGQQCGARVFGACGGDGGE